MANYSQLNNSIRTAIKTNGNNEITGQLLQQVLLSMVSNLGAQFQFAGVLTPSTPSMTPPDYNVAYLAGPGTYANFGGIVIPDGRIGVIMYNGSWSVQTIVVGSGGGGSIPIATNVTLGGIIVGSGLSIDASGVLSVIGGGGGGGTYFEPETTDLELVAPAQSGQPYKLKFANRINGTNITSGKNYVILRETSTFAAQVTSANTVYEIRYVFDLSNASVNIPANCELFFNGGSITNGTIVGNKTVTNKLDPDHFAGDFYLGDEYHNFSSAISSPLVLENKVCIFHNQFALSSYLDFTNCDVSGINAVCDVSGLLTISDFRANVRMNGGRIHDCEFTFNNSSAASMDKTKIYVVLYVSNNADVDKCNFHDFNSTVYGNSACILIAPTSLFRITGCTFKNISAQSDGGVGGNSGSFRGIQASFDYTHTDLGYSEIVGCNLENIWSYTGTPQSPTEILDDCDGIYIAGVYNGDSLKPRDVVIRGCHFKNVRKRSIKLQSEGVKIEDCTFDESGGSGSTYVEATIGVQCHDLDIVGCDFNQCEHVMVHMYAGKITIQNCNFDGGFSIVNESVLNQIVDIIGCNINMVMLVEYDSGAYGSGDVLLNVYGSVVDLTRFYALSEDTKLYYSNCIINTERLAADAYYGGSGMMDGVHFDTCVINFDIRNFASDVSLFDFANRFFIKDSTVNVKCRYDSGNASVKSSGYIFRSSYHVQGQFQADNVKLNLDHPSDLAPFSGVTIYPTAESFFRNINVDNTPNNVMISNGGPSSTYFPMIYDGIKLGSGQKLFLNGPQNTIIRNMGTPGVYSTDDKIVVGYSDVDVLLDNVFVLVSEASPDIDKILGVRTLGTRGYIYNGVNKVVRRKYFLNGNPVFLTRTNLDSDMSSDLPTLQSSDAGTIKYSTTNSKMVAWNGSAWVNMDGTAL